MPHIQQIMRRITNDACLFIQNTRKRRKKEEDKKKTLFLINKFNFLFLLLCRLPLKNQN